MRCASSSGPTGPRCKPTDATCSNDSRSSTSRARWSASAAWEHGRSSCCCKAATSRTRCSCRSRRPQPRCWRTICPRAATGNPGERVVQGQRMMQASSDIYLGWTKGVQENRHLYWRQLRDMKGSAVVESMKPFSADVLRQRMRMDPGPGSCPVRRPDRDSCAISARRMTSTSRSPTSPSDTRIRTRRTTRRSPKRSAPDG